MKGGKAEPTELDSSVGEGIRTGMYFKNVEMIWDPVMTVLDTLYAPDDSVGEALLLLEHQVPEAAPDTGTLDDQPHASACVRSLCPLLRTDCEGGPDDRQAQRARCSQHPVIDR